MSSRRIREAPGSVLRPKQRVGPLERYILIEWRQKRALSFNPGPHMVILSA